MRRVPLLVSVALVSGCAHTVTNEERLEGMTDVVIDSTADARELRCRDTAPEVQIARDATKRKAERLARYQWAVADAKSTHARFEEAFRKEPDLVYGPKGEEWKRRQVFCAELAVTLQKEQAKVELEPDREPVVVAKKMDTTPPPDSQLSLPRKSEEPKKTEKASAADDAFEDDGDAAQLRSSYKKKSKVAKAKSKKSRGKKKAVSLAHR